MVKAKFNFLLLERAGILVILAGSSVASALSYVQKLKAPFSSQGSVAQNEDSPFRKREVDTTFEKQYQKLWMGGSRRQIIDTLLYARDLSRERTLELVENLERENDALTHIYEMEYGSATPDVAGNGSQPFGIENTLADNIKVVLRRSDPVKITNRHRKVRRFEVNFDLHEPSGKTSVPKTRFGLICPASALSRKRKEVTVSFLYIVL